MKTTKNIAAAIAFALCLLFANESKAQYYKNSYFNVDWQLNFPVNNGFADKMSGWGANLDGGYLVNDNVGVGGFVSFHTNLEYIPRQTIQLSETSAVNTDQEHSVFQLPFGATVRYMLGMPDQVGQPYIALKLGANYAEMTSFYNAFESYDTSWGFFLSPEVGINIFPGANGQYALHLAAYFSYATNSMETLAYEVKGLSNFGLRVGLGF